MNDDQAQAASIADGTEQELEAAILYAKKYLEDLLSFLGLNADVHATHEDDVIQLNIPSTRMNGFLIGQHGDNMRAMQFIIISALKNQNHPYVRVNLDVAGYKQQRSERLAKSAVEWIGQVKQSGKPLELQPMNAADRRVVHQVATEAGLATESVGEGRDRYIVLKPGAEA